jgi:hypothetical protein
MEFERIRKQKIDKKYIDEAFKEIPLYESMAVTTDQESYRLARELLTMGGHTHSQPTVHHIPDSFSDVSAPTLQSLYLSPGAGHEDNNSFISGGDHPSRYGKGTPGKKNNLIDFSPSNYAERNILPQILRDKPLESPGKSRYNKSPINDLDGIIGNKVSRAESYPIKETITEDEPPSWDDITEFRGKFTEVKRTVLNNLIQDLQKKEDDYYTINFLRTEKGSRVYPHKIFMLCGGQEEILDFKNLQYKYNLEILKSKLTQYFEPTMTKSEDGVDKKVLIYVYLIYQRGRAWEYLKLMMEGSYSSGITYKYSLYNPSYPLETPTNEVLEKYIEGILRQLIAPHAGIKRSSKRKQRSDKGLSTSSGCSIWDSGIEVYKRLAKDYAKLSHEKISREQLYFLLVEKFYHTQYDQ